MMTGTARKNSTTSQHGQRTSRVVGELADAEDQPEDDGAEHRGERHLQGVEQALDQSAST